jgi:hypothetical protein
MKKKAFLAPLAVSVAALLAVAPAQATPAIDDVAAKPAVEISAQLPDATNAFVIERADPSPVLLAQHRSHMSHSSHSSHSSHASHYSGR